MIIMSKSQKQTSKQGNTLLSYFSKTPKKDSDVLSPRKSPNNCAIRTPESAGKKNAKAKASTPSPKGSPPVQEVKFHCGDVVWAKLVGYPWWPSLVCNHPSTGTHTRSDKKPEVHVQFFDTPPTHAWVNSSNVKPFQGSLDKECQRGGQFFTTNMKVKKNAEAADKALKMTVKKRLELVVNLQPSDEEEENGEVDEDMDLDPDIFDAEMSEENDDSIKENKVEEPSDKQSPAKQQAATPKKRPRAAQRAGSQPKRRKIVQPESGEEDSGDEFKPDSSDESGDESVSSGEEENEISEPHESEPDSPIKKNKKKKTVLSVSTDKKSLPLGTPKNSGSPFQPSVSSATKSKLSLFAASDNVGSSAEGGQVDASNFPHTRLDFLQPDKIRDINQKNKNDPEYDPRTLYVPASFLNKQTPAMRQWWELKSKHFDTVLFFKMGKFYEFFHMDATTGVEKLGLIYMKGDYAHSGFPEIAYNRYADALIQKGYKVARVEQTETPEMMAERCKQMARPATKYDKVVQREICQVTTQGTRTFSPRDGDVGDAQPSYLMAICEADGSGGITNYGVCFVDTSIGTFHLGQFPDDRHCSRLRTVFAHHAPAQILYERGRMSYKTLQLINGQSTALKEALCSGKEFWESSKTLKTLLEEDYFKDEGSDFQWPDTLKRMMSESDALGLTAADAYDLALRSLGAVTWYLQYCLMDHEVLSMNKFEEYEPPDRAPLKMQTSLNTSQRHMVLDGVSLCNLEVVKNAATSGAEGTLLEQLDTCSTPFGKRLLVQWLCAPLCQPASISDRLDAVESLMEMQELATEAADALKKLPNLERLLSRIHSLGSLKRKCSHPAERAILYEETHYSKRKIEDFLATVGGFKAGMKLADKFTQQAKCCRSKLLRKTVLLDSKVSDGGFPDITEDLAFFDNAFDHAKARKDGIIIPSKGVDKEFDKAVGDVQHLQTQLDEYLEQQRQRLGCKGIVYWGTGKNRFQMEIPESALKHVPEEYELMSSKKGAKRYRTTTIEALLADLTDAEERKDAALKDIMRRIFHSFDERYAKWNNVVASLSVLDVLLALVHYSRCSESSMCRPQFLLPDNETKPFLEIREGRHPCISRSVISSDFIPNDTVIGLKEEVDEDGNNIARSHVVMVTGPNMGGKSTLMRQTGLIVVLAQLGCYVPAEKCCLTPVDRIFTRLGASDRIMSGESTFFVELSETSAILQHATEHSLVLMDELGRGTATYDGTAIAFAVVKELSENLGCRSLFSTHYHCLVDQFSHDQNVRTGHMACMVENEDEGDPSQETITFLYKFVKGACPKSYGFNAARLASLPEEVIRCAIAKAREFESTVECLRLMRKLWSCTCENIKETLPEFYSVTC